MYSDCSPFCTDVIAPKFIKEPVYIGSASASGYQPRTIKKEVNNSYKKQQQQKSKKIKNTS